MRITTTMSSSRVCGANGDMRIEEFLFLPVCNSANNATRDSRPQVAVANLLDLSTEFE